MKYKIFMDDNVIDEPSAALSQPELRNLCKQYAARLIDIRNIQRSFYKGLSQVREEVTEYRFTRVPKA